MKPKSFVMNNPGQFGIGGTWAFRLYAEPSLIAFVANLAPVYDLFSYTSESCAVSIDPRWDYEEAWLWIYEQLETEAQEVDLDAAVWGELE